MSGEASLGASRRRNPKADYVVHSPRHFAATEESEVDGQEEFEIDIFVVDEVKTAGKEKDPWSDGDPWKRFGATSGKGRTGGI